MLYVALNIILSNLCMTSMALSSKLVEFHQEYSLRYSSLHRSEHFVIQVAIRDPENLWLFGRFGQEQGIRLRVNEGPRSFPDQRQSHSQSAAANMESRFLGTRVSEIISLDNST
jgi:hypothetical protein